MSQKNYNPKQLRLPHFSDDTRPNKGQIPKIVPVLTQIYHFQHSFGLDKQEKKKGRWNRLKVILASSSTLFEQLFAFPGNRASRVILFLWRYIFCYLCSGPQYWWGTFSSVGGLKRSGGELLCRHFISQWLLTQANLFQQIRPPTHT